MDYLSKPLDDAVLCDQSSYESLVPRDFRKSARPHYSELGQDLWVLNETQGKRRGIFVEFGAGDGVKNSNTYLLEKFYGWQGVLSEPHPDFFHKACEQRSVPVAHRCIYPGPEREVPFLLTPNPHLSTIADFASADHHAEERAHGYIVSATTLPLYDLLRQYEIPQIIDYMSIDTEGSEFDIISDFDFKLYDIRLISIEHNYTYRREQIQLILEQAGYLRKFSGMTEYDDWYVKIS